MAAGPEDPARHAAPEAPAHHTGAEAPARPAGPEDPAHPGAGRIYRGELTAALSALALLVVMFATKWYGVAGVPDPSAARPALSGAVDAWNALTLVRWVMLATILAAIGSVVVHASQRSHGTRTDTSAVLFVLGTATAALVVYRVLIDLPQASRVIDQKLGAFLGIVCALGIALGGMEAVAEQRTGAHSGPVRHRPRRAGSRGQAPNHAE